MDLSIIIVSYNTKKLILQCIEAIVKFTKKINYEIIVIDNASIDGTIEKLEALQKKFKNIYLIKNKENIGFSKANNQAIKRASGKYILLLNSDTKIKKGSLEKIVEYAEQTSDAGVVGAKLLNPDGSIQPSCFNFPTVDKVLRQFWLGEKGLVDKFFPKVKVPVEVNAVVGAAFLITPKAREKAGLLDEKYFMYYEDIDYCRKVWNVGLKVYYLPSVEIVHYHGQSGKGLGQIQKNRLFKSSKSYHSPLKHYLINFIIWSGQEWQNLRKNQS